MRKVAVVVGVALGALFAEGKCDGRRLKSYDCPDGYQMDGGFCVNTVVQTPKAGCIVGTLDGDQCVQVFSATKGCPPDFEMREDKCVRYEQAVPRTICEPGYYLEGLRCVGSKLLEPQCPADTVAVEDDKCAMYNETCNRCPVGFRPVGGYHKGAAEGAECEKYVSAPPMKTCPEPFTLVDDCTCKYVKNVPKECPYGSKDEGEMCSIYKNAQVRCRDGFTMFQGTEPKCMLTETQDVMFSCDQPGYVLKGRVCEKVVPVQPVCAPGQTEVGDGRCAVYHAAKPQCLPDFDMSYVNGGIQCKKAVRLPQEVECGDGYEVSGSSCVKSVPSPMVCPPGSHEMGDGSCEVKSAASVRCNAGFNLTGQKCLRTESVEAMPGCKGAGYVLTGMEGICEKRKTCDPMYVCRKGAREGESCVEYQRTPLQYTCPDGFVSEAIGQFGGTRCAQKVVKDCSTIEYEMKCYEVPECFNEERLARGAKDCQPIHVPECYTKHQCEQMIRGRRLFAGSGAPVCEKVAVRREKNCEKVLFADARTVCPSGATVHGKGCAMKTHHMAEPQCPKGVYDNVSKQCVMLKKKPAVYSCPAEFQKLAGGRRCSRSIFEAVMRYCDSTTMVLKGSLCATNVARVCEGGVCERKVAILGDTFCPDGFVKIGTECVHDDTVMARYLCEEGELVEGTKCAKYFAKQCPGGKCERVLHAAVKQYCYDGFEEKFVGGKSVCQRSVYEGVDYLCLEQSVLNGNRCVTYVPKKCPGGECEIFQEQPFSYTCPSGYSQQTQTLLNREGALPVKCVARQTAPLIRFCHEEEVLEDKRCVRYFEKACPNNNCIVPVSVPPTFLCDNGFTRKDGGICQGVAYEKPLYNCLKGALNGSRCRLTTMPLSSCPRGSSKIDGMCVTKGIRKPMETIC